MMLQGHGNGSFEELWRDVEGGFPGERQENCGAAEPDLP